MITTEHDQPALIDCRTAASALYDFLDGRMPGASMAAVQHHIDRCAECASHYDFARRVLSLLPTSVPLDADCDALRARILESLRQDTLRA